MLPTTPANLTEQGTVLGTFQYMAPEQLEGQEADARTDLFAFGVVLYEMLAGRRAFEGKTHASLLGAILKDQPPPVSTLRPLAPASLDHVVGKCLEKDPESALAFRARSARRAGVDRLRPSRIRGVATHAARPARRTAGWIAAVAVAALSAAALDLRVGMARHAGRLRRAGDAPADRSRRPTPASAGFALSPDRRALVYQAAIDGRPRLWLRMLDSDAARPLDGTDRSSSGRRRSGRRTAGRLRFSRLIS